MSDEVWHKGEKELHRLLDVEQLMLKRGAAMIRDAMPEQHRIFFANLQFVVLSAVDAGGQPWPFMRVGPPGFINSPSDTVLTINATALAGEPADLQLGPGDKIGVLGIELETRRRNRMNGTLSAGDAKRMTIDVDQSFGNCPRYINKREPAELCDTKAFTELDSRLSAEDIAHIRSSDIFFIASRAPVTSDDRRAGVDVNHRGGKAGFVKVLHDQTIIFPDYDGNKFFNTLGNILLDDRVGLVFPDFEKGHLLSVAGRAELVIDDQSHEAEYGAARYVRVTPTHLIRATGGLPLRYAMQEVSSYSPPPGDH